MVDARGVELDGQGHARAGLQLTGVHADAQTAGSSRGEHLSRLLGGERPALAEDVDPACVGGARVEHRSRHQVDVRIRIVGVFGRHHVRPEERGLVGHLARQPQHPGLVVDCQAVAALDLEGRRALCQQLRDEAGESRPQRALVGGAGGGDRAPYSAGGIRLARHPRLELR